MKLFGKVLNLKPPFARRDNETLKRERFVSGILQTSAFSKLSIQDKVLSLGRLIAVFRKDCGFTPRSLARVMKTLTMKVKVESDRSFRSDYSDHSKSSPIKASGPK